MSATGRFITLEGPEGSGKTTAARHLAEWLRGRGVSTVLTHEPGGTPLGEEVRRIVLHMRGMSDDLDPRADALLYAAGRAQHVARVIRPALERGEWVVCARFLDSSLAYQGAGYGNDPEEMRRLQAFATGSLCPTSPSCSTSRSTSGSSAPVAAPSGTVSRTPRRSPSSNASERPICPSQPASQIAFGSWTARAPLRRPMRRSARPSRPSSAKGRQTPTRQPTRPVVGSPTSPARTPSPGPRRPWSPPGGVALCFGGQGS